MVAIGVALFFVGLFFLGSTVMVSSLIIVNKKPPIIQSVDTKNPHNNKTDSENESIVIKKAAKFNNEKYFKSQEKFTTNNEKIKTNFSGDESEYYTACEDSNTFKDNDEKSETQPANPLDKEKTVEPIKEDGLHDTNDEASSQNQDDDIVSKENENEENFNILPDKHGDEENNQKNLNNVLIVKYGTQDKLSDSNFSDSEENKEKNPLIYDEETEKGKQNFLIREKKIGKPFNNVKKKDTVFKKTTKKTKEPQ
ncbi:hypothetical protein GVAV_000950 [Gurleya vavrai]